jgi:mono/diheme cytochrome c family protein
MNISMKVVSVACLLAAAPLVASAADASENWTKHCAKCHGPDGAAKTTMARNLKIRDLTDPAVQAAITDAALAASLTDGVKTEAGKQVMPSFSAKLTPEEIQAMQAYVRALAKKPE